MATCSLTVTKSVAGVIGETRGCSAALPKGVDVCWHDDHISEGGHSRVAIEVLDISRGGVHCWGDSDTVGWRFALAAATGQMVFLPIDVAAAACSAASNLK